MRMLFLLVCLSPFFLSAQDSLSHEVRFNVNSYTLTPRDSIALLSFADSVLKMNVQRIRIEGHSDESGEAISNYILSVNRAKTVNRILQNHIQQAVQITYKGFGSSHLKYGKGKKPENRRTFVSVFFKPAEPTVVKEKPVQKIPNVDSLKEGETINLKNLQFYSGEARLMPQSEPTIKQLALF